MMDRLALHKSRLESDSLRRNEVSSFLHQNERNRPKSADATNARFAPFPRRPMSANEKFARKSKSVGNFNDYNSSPDTSPERGTKFGEETEENENGNDNENENEEEEEEEHNSLENDGQVVRMQSQGMETQSTVPKASRTVVVTSKREILPMRFRTDNYLT